MLHVRAFSLIELMVVIAIVAVLAAIAVPAYQGYIKKTKISEAAYHLDAIGRKFISYYETKGSFPTGSHSSMLSAIGVTSVDPSNVSEYLVPPSLAQISFLLFTEATPGSCAYARVTGDISNVDSGAYPDAPYSIINVVNFYVDVNGVWEKICAFSDTRVTGVGFESNASTAIPGCYNLAIPADSTAVNNEFLNAVGSCS